MNKAFEKILDRLDSHIEDAKSEGDFSYIKPFEIAKIAVWEAAEEYNGGWIHCNKELPPQPKENPIFENKQLELYLVTVKNTKYAFRAFWNGKQFTDGWGILDVIAWQPLPEPFKECD